jgi:nitrogen regulatory protein P-II 1
MKKIELFIPDRRLDDVVEVLKDANIGGMSHYRIEGRGKIKPEEIYVGRGTMTYKPKFIPRTKVEVVVSDEEVERLITAFRNRLGDNIGGKLFVLTSLKRWILARGKWMKTPYDPTE